MKNVSYLCHTPQGAHILSEETMRVKPLNTTTNNSCACSYFLQCIQCVLRTRRLKFDSSLKRPDSSHKSESRVPLCERQVAPYTDWRGTSQPLWHCIC